jgi:positive regulator of sigma E activity
VASEEGIVNRIDTLDAWVETLRSDCCTCCSSKSTCYKNGGKKMEVYAMNAVGARVGDRVVCKMNTARFLKAAFLVHLLPVFLLLVGASAGEWLARSTAPYSPLPAVLLGLGSLALGFVLTKLTADRLARWKSYQPHIARVIPRRQARSS